MLSFLVTLILWVFWGFALDNAGVKALTFEWFWIWVSTFMLLLWFAYKPEKHEEGRATMHD